MNEMKLCPYCKEMKSRENDFNILKSGKRKGKPVGYCKKCILLKGMEYDRKHPRRSVIRNHELGITRPMEKAVESSLYLGVVIAETALSTFFDTIIRMPHCNEGYDFLCGKGYKIDAKSSCLKREKTSPNSYRWVFNTRKNDIADYFIFLGFDNRKNLTPMHTWLVPCEIVKDKTGVTITNSVNCLSKWEKYERPIDNAIECCNKMRET